MAPSGRPSPLLVVKLHADMLQVKTQQVLLALLSSCFLLSDSQRLFLCISPPLVTPFQSVWSEAAVSLIQEVFLLCFCIKKVTVEDSFNPRWTHCRS